MKCIFRLVLMFFFTYSLQAQKKINTADILKQAEQKRIPWPEMSCVASVSDSGGSNYSISYYRVFFGNHKALVSSMAPSLQKGNLLLLQDNEMWLYIHNTAQPMKITPLQRLSGSVSFVDMAKLDWAKDFTVDSYETIKSGANKEAYLLHMHALTNDISYRKINLLVDKSTKNPIKADIYLSSDKIYKTLLFTKYQLVDGKEVNTQIDFIDFFNKGKKSVLQFSKIKKEKNIPMEYFAKEKMAAISKVMMGIN